MSYLHLPRLIFTGDFKSDVSTINNQPQYYNNDTFQASFQEPQTQTNPPNNGYWNPEGGASFDFVNCKVEQIILPDGSAPADDIIVGCWVGTPDDRAGGKMVDLDPQQQGVSQLWSVTLRIYTSENELLLQGDIKPMSFRDLQFRQTGGTNTQPLGAGWTTVLTNIVWGEKSSDSSFLAKLKAVTQGDKLSLNLNAYGYYRTHVGDRFSLGRIIGSIGPWFEGEPEFFAPARRLYGLLEMNSPRNPIYFNYSNFLFENEQKRLTIDFGGSFPVADAFGTIQNPEIPNPTGIIKEPQKFIVALSNDSIAYAPATDFQLLEQDDFTTIGELNFQTGSDWLRTTGGIVAFDNLPDDISGKLVNQQLVLLTPASTSVEKYVLIAREAVDGYLVRADDFVQRLDYNQTKKVYFYAYQWGTPLAFQDIQITLAAATKPTAGPICEIPGNNYPPDGLSFSSLVQTDASGRACLEITGNAIHSPRVYIDGQIYFVNYQLQNIPNDSAGDEDMLSIYLMDYFEVPENPTWSDISEIMTQYSNLYPIMSKYVVDLSNPIAVKAKKDILIFAFTRDINDPMHMPVTRDLSEAKRQTILKWLKEPELRLGEGVARFDKPLTASPTSLVGFDVKLTEKQIRFKNLVEIKSGTDLSSGEIEPVSEDQ